MKMKNENGQDCEVLQVWNVILDVSLRWKIAREFWGNAVPAGRRKRRVWFGLVCRTGRVDVLAVGKTV